MPETHGCSLLLPLLLSRSRWWSADYVTCTGQAMTTPFPRVLALPVALPCPSLHNIGLHSLLPVGVASRISQWPHVGLATAKPSQEDCRAINTEGWETHFWLELCTKCQAREIDWEMKGRANQWSRDVTSHIKPNLNKRIQKTTTKRSLYNASSSQAGFHFTGMKIQVDRKNDQVSIWVAKAYNIRRDLIKLTFYTAKMTNPKG